ncbi:polysaccharide pyruvyl transferase family protein [Vibrio parahaemolyticus]|uniref:polysaccharide pyruvyl transferase family protein n=1 Tax=Vibrio parahaemolyticus TaxID=670 RepID=UPI00215CE023|nr:polysaccharide pyruvyl transferase family protein [Vibrio parahaemolyticus]MCS0062827.1 polysaccharide pyruvyl transferase family protein [Vibrio parahaemolyticus]
MKICILTQPLHKNYGGLLQAYALQKVLIEMGHDVFTADIPFKKPKLLGLPSFIRSCIKRYVLKQQVSRLWPLSQKEKSFIQKETDRFIRDNLVLTECIKSTSSIDKLSAYGFDAYVVGSDQVWRPLYSPGILSYFFDFLEGRDDVKRLSYAASFGIDSASEYSNELVPRVSKLLKQFDLVTVRESSGVQICESAFGVHAEHVVDPTLLLKKNDYIKLVEFDQTPKSEGELFVYVLDQGDSKKEVIDFVKKETQLKDFTVLPETPYETYPAVTQWVRAFMDAKYVVTDSFHGVAFCIIFNIPFIAIGNEERGLARFTSILSKFDLMERLVTSVNDISEELIHGKIDFDRVNKVRAQEIQLSQNLLREVLEDKGM